MFSEISELSFESSRIWNERIIFFNQLKIQPRNILGIFQVKLWLDSTPIVPDAYCIFSCLTIIFVSPLESTAFVWKELLSFLSTIFFFISVYVYISYAYILFPQCLTYRLKKYEIWWIRSRDAGEKPLWGHRNSSV